MSKNFIVPNHPVILKILKIPEDVLLVVVISGIDGIVKVSFVGGTVGGSWK